MSEVSQDDSNDDDYDDDESDNSEDEDPLSAAVCAIHASSGSGLQSGQMAKDDGLDGGSGPPGPAFLMSTYRDVGEEAGRSNILSLRKSLMVATGSNTGHASSSYIYSLDI